MTEKAYGFGKSAIDELNKQPGTQRLPARQFALLMAGSAALLLLLYLQIVLVNTAVGSVIRGWAATVLAPARIEYCCAGASSRRVSNVRRVEYAPLRRT
jgi:hypothetical protein